MNEVVRKFLIDSKNIIHAKFVQKLIEILWKNLLKIIHAKLNAKSKHLRH